jgi:hypothetical protein
MAVSNNRPTLIIVWFSLTCAVVSDLSFWEGEGLENIIFISLPFKKHVVASIQSKAATTCLQQWFHLTTWHFQVDILLATGIQKTSVIGSADLKPTFESLSTVSFALPNSNGVSETVAKNQPVLGGY